MAKIKFILNGKPKEIEKGATILDIAQQNGVSIPTLCHDPRLKPTAACRLCLVEVEGARSPMPACATTIVEGMKINTFSENLFNLRKTALELLLSDHYGDCIAPCKLACPAGIDIQGFIAHIANGQYKEALKLIKESNPLPLVCGRVCPRFCEQKCRRNIVDQPVAINALKRFVADFDLNSGDTYVPAKKSDTGYKVAIVGGGPAGLSAAYYLAIEGHAVTIFDANPRLGGMLRYGIPEYRLPKAILDREIEIITNLCSEVKLNTKLGKDFTIEKLKEDGFDAIFIGLGACASQKMKVDGEELPNVISGIQFLRDIALNKKIKIGKKVAIVGGGNTAIDTARTALRLGAKEVTLIYRRSRKEMPASAEEVEQAELEGVKFCLLSTPTRIIEKGGKAVSLECIKMQLGEPDSSGRRRPVPAPGSEFCIDVDTVITAIGQKVEMTGVPDIIQNAQARSVSANKETMETELSGVFAGGDCVTGPATVVEAIAAGKRAAESINQYLIKGRVDIPVRHYNCSKGELNQIDAKEYDKVERLPRVRMPALPVEERRHNFKEVETGLTEEMAKAESSRCLACGCLDVFECQLRVLATEYQVDDKKYVGRKHHYAVDEKEHENILRDPNKCVLCGRCVRICSEVQGIGALGYIRRGFDTIIGPAIGVPLSETLCESCGQCISACPTGAITEKIKMPKAGPWKLESVNTVCPYCSIGCNLQLNVTGNKVVNVTSAIDSPVNQGNLCKNGKFNYIKILNSNRVKTPLIKKDDNLVESSWDETMKLIAEKLRAIVATKDGGKLAVVTSGQLTNEEFYLVQKIARGGLRTNNIGSVVSADVREGFIKENGKDKLNCKFADIVNSDLIIILGSDITMEYPVVASYIRKAISNGSKLVTISPGVTRLDYLAKINLRVNARTILAFIRAVLNYIIDYDIVDHNFVDHYTTGFSDLVEEMKKYPFNNVVDLFWVKPSRIIEAIHLYVRAKRPVLIVNGETVKAEEQALIRDLFIITGNANREGCGIITLYDQGNVQGQIEMGALPDYLPGKKKINNEVDRKKIEAIWNFEIPQLRGKNTDEILEAVKSGGIRSLMVVGSDALERLDKDIFRKVEFSILMNTKIPDSQPYPDVVLPWAAFIETDGTFINSEESVQFINHAVRPPCGRQNWEVLVLLGNALGITMEYKSLADINGEMSRLISDYNSSKIKNYSHFFRDIVLSSESTNDISCESASGSALEKVKSATGSFS